MAADLTSIMPGLASALGGITGLRVYDHPADKVAVPAAVVGLPDEVTYDDTMARGADRLEIPVYLLVGRAAEAAAAKRLAGYLGGAGAESVKAAIEDDPTLGGAAASVRVTSAEVSVVTVGGIDYLAAIFHVEAIA